MDIISYIEKQQTLSNKIYSVMNIDDIFKDLKRFDANPNLNIEYENVLYKENNFIVDQRIWKSANGFYILAERIPTDYYLVKIYYDVAKQNEVKLFIKYLKK